jgi:arabinogalactan endo-1,4-beta-galactosidase
VHAHTFEVLTALKRQATSPLMVQIGNEITNGMLWPDGRARITSISLPSCSNLGSPGLARQTRQSKSCCIMYPPMAKDYGKAP